jgi:hypothetical protein
MTLKLFSVTLHSHFDIYSDNAVDKILFMKSRLCYKRKGQKCFM